MFTRAVQLEDTRITFFERQYTFALSPLICVFECVMMEEGNMTRTVRALEANYTGPQFTLAVRETKLIRHVRWASSHFRTQGPLYAD